MAAHGDNTTREQFRSDARVVGLQINSAHVEPEADKPSLSGEFVIQAGAAASERDLRVKGGGVESVSGTAGANFTASIFEALREKDRQRREATSQLVNFLDMLNALDRQIAFLDARIAEYDTQIAELKVELGALEELKELLESGEYDPTNPDHMRLLELSGIPHEDWGILTPEIVDDRIQTTRDEIEDLEEKRRRDIQRRTDIQKDRDDLHKRMSADSNIESDPETAEIAEDQRKQFYDVERQLSETETEWFHRVISIAPRADWDRLIDQLEDVSVSDFRFDESFSTEVRDYLLVHEFEERFEKYCEGVPTEEHHFVLMEVLENDLEPQDLETLIRSSETPEYIRAAINELGLSTPGQNQDLHLGKDQ